MTFVPNWMPYDRSDDEDDDANGDATVEFTISLDQCRAMQKAAGEFEYVLHNAAAVFEMLQLAIVNGQDDAGITATMELAAMGLRRFAENEGQQIGRLDTNLRAVLREAAKEELAQ